MRELSANCIEGVSRIINKLPIGSGSLVSDISSLQIASVRRRLPVDVP